MCLFLSITWAPFHCCNCSEFFVPHGDNIVLQIGLLKNQCGLRRDFLEKTKQIFNRDVFIETGTFGGGSTASALPVFNEIYTVELSPQFHRQAALRFKSNKHVQVLLGESNVVLSKILPLPNKKIIFWLDAHWCGDGTARAKKLTPIVEELQAIRNSATKDAVILVDDICYFPCGDPSSFPTVKQLYHLIKAINDDYVFVIVGDAALAYPATQNIMVSRFLQACTASRLYEDGDDIDIIKEEKVIAQANDREFACIKKVLSMRRDGQAAEYYYLWLGLMQFNKGLYLEAYKSFKSCIECGSTLWRVKWYLSETAHHLGYKQEALKNVTEVMRLVPHFGQAKQLFGVLSRE
jgi:hypothetical protein